MLEGKVSGLTDSSTSEDEASGTVKSRVNISVSFIVIQIMTDIPVVLYHC